MELTKRKQNILASIVTGYIQTGEPIGSKSISEAAGVSSATVRNEMAELTALGLLEQPHTSAGRVPSALGYRVFVDHLMVPQTLSPEERNRIDAMLLKSAFDPERLLRGASVLLAEETRCMTVCTTPNGENAIIKAVQFVQTSRRTAMLIMMSSAGTMKNKVFHCDFDLSNEIMRIFFRVFNERVSGVPVAEITRAFVQSLAVSFGDLAIILSPALVALLEVAQDSMVTEMYVNGQINLLFYPEYQLGGFRRVMELMDRQEQISKMLSGKPRRVHVRIGAEIGRPELYASSLVFSRYSINGADSGAIAVLGPMRMDYAHIAAKVAHIADRVGEHLTRLMREE